MIYRYTILWTFPYKSNPKNLPYESLQKFTLWFTVISQYTYDLPLSHYTYDLPLSKYTCDLPLYGKKGKKVWYRIVSDRIVKILKIDQEYYQILP